MRFDDEPGSHVFPVHPATGSARLPHLPVRRRPATLLVFGLVLSFLSVAGAPATAPGSEVRPTDYTRREWHTQDGLPSEEVNQLLQDRKGYLWVSTTGGISRFDGSHFVRIPLSAPPGVRGTPYVRALAESDTLGLVVAPSWGGAARLEFDGSLHALPFHEALGGQGVSTLWAEPDGTLWVARSDETVIRHDAHSTRQFPLPSRLTGAKWIGFARDRHGRTWVASGADLYRYESGRLVPHPLPFSDSELRITSSRGDGPWVLTTTHLHRMEEDRLVPVAELPALLGAHYVQALTEDATGIVWLGTRSRGLHWVNGGRLTHFRGSHDDIYSLRGDREGNIWVGSNGMGLQRVRPKTYRIYDKNDGLLLDFSTTVCQDRDGAMWFANRDGGVVRLGEGGFRTFPHLPGWPSYSAVSVFPRPEGGIGFTCGSGVYRVGFDGGTTIQRILEIPEQPIIRDTYVARNGATWMSLGAGRIGRFEHGAFQTFGAAEGFVADEVRTLAEDGEGRILAGTVDGQVLRYDGARFAALPLGSAAPRRAIQAILAERDVLWLGTEGDGLLVFMDGALRTVGPAHGLPHPELSQILADDLGHLWFGSRTGIFRVSRQELLDCAHQRITRVHPILVGKDDGLAELTCLGLFQPAGWKSRDGRLWFATRRGVLSLDPAAQIAPPAPPPVEIVGIRHDGHRVARREAGAVPAGIRKLEFDFSVLCLSTPQRVQARHRLDGFDTDWVISGPQHNATYPRLPPGAYTFRVIAGIGDGALNQQGDSLSFTVEPRWWQTLAFRIAAVAATLLVVAGAARGWSHRRLRRRLERLEQESAIERERTRIAQNIHDDLGASLTRISLLTQSAQHASPETPQFEQIYATVSDITRSMDEIVWAVNPKYDDLDSLAYYISNFAQTFLSAAGIRCRLDMPEHLPPVRLTSQLRHLLFLGCKEAMNNVVKHAGATSVTVHLGFTAEVLTVSIHDNGRGLAASRDTGAPRDRILTGHGVSSLQTRLAEAGGSCEVSDQPGPGTTVTLRIAVPAIPAPTPR